MEHALSAWDTYNESLSSLQAWLGQEAPRTLSHGAEVPPKNHVPYGQTVICQQCLLGYCEFGLKTNSLTGYTVFYSPGVGFIMHFMNKCSFTVYACFLLLTLHVFT